MIYLALGEAVRQGKVLYRDVHDNKPPLLYLLAALAGSVFWFKVILAFWNLATIFLFWKFAQIIFKNSKKATKAATIIFAVLTTIPLLEGNIANAEIFMIATTIGAFYILFTKAQNFKNIALAGALFSLSALFKMPALFELPVIFFFWLFTMGKINKDAIVKTAKKFSYLLVGFSIPILITFVWYFAKGAFSEYVTAAFLQNVGYLSSFRPGDVQKSFLVRNAPLLIRGAITFIGVGIVGFYRKRLSKEFMFATIWLLFTLFAVALSERPYPHYLIQSVPPASLLFAMLLTKKNIEQSLTVIPLAVMFIVPFYYNFWHYSTVSYYSKFTKFALGKIDKQEYILTFGGHIPKIYEAAEIINQSSKRDEPVFVWGGDSSLVYALSRRLPPIKYVAQYHISDFSSNKEVFKALEKENPQLIVILGDAPPFPELIPFLRENYYLIDTTDGIEIWSLISPQVKNLIAPQSGL